MARTLSARFRADVRVGRPIGLGDPKTPVDLVPIVHGCSGMPRCVVAKRFGPKPHLTPQTRFANEAAALSWLGRLDETSPLVPRLYATERTQGVVIMEFIGDAELLGEVLYRDDPDRARAALCATARALAQLHGATIGLQAAHAALRRRWAAPLALPRHEGYLAAYKRVLQACDVRSRPGTIGEIRDAIAILDDAGPFVALSHGDLCLDNILHHDGRVWLLDFEGAAFGNVAVDIAALGSGFLSCGCAGRLPVSVVEQIDRVYRRALSRACPSAVDDGRYRRAHMAALMSRTLWPWNDAWLDEDRRWGTCTQRQRVLARFEHFVECATAYRVMPALAATLTEAGTALRARWGNPPAIPLFPAFRDGPRPR